jgi:hypothetical protein
MRRIRLGTTDAQGQWLCSTIPSARTWFAFEFEHPDFVKNTLSVNREDETEVGRQTLTRLRSRSLVTTMRAGAVTFGQVVDGNGEPIPGARIGTSWHELGVLTDQDGQFTVHSLPRGEVMFIASAEGYAPRKFRAQAGGEAARVQLDPGGLVRARIVDTQGEPIADATLVLEDGFGDGALGWDGKTDADGRVEWRSAPPERTFTFTAYAPGYRYRRQFPLTADAHQEHTVTLEPDLVVGQVLDADTAQPIAWFKAIPGQGREHPDFERSGLHYVTNGVYQLRFSELGEPVVRVEAEGYETEVGYPERGPNGEPRCDFRLRRADPNGGVRGVVLNPDGSPAAGADVVLCTLETYAVLGRERFLKSNHSIVTNADTRGRFAFPVVRTPHTVAAVSALGFGRASVRSNAPVTVRLEPFGEIEGVVLRDGEPQKEKRVALSDPGYSRYSGAVSLDVAAFEALTDAAGRFRIDRVPAGDFLLYLNPGVGIPMTDETHVSVAAGEVARVVMGEPDPAGRTLVGRLKSSETLPVTDWRRHLTTYNLSRKLPVVQPPAGLSEDARQLWWVTWHQSPVGREQARQRRSHAVIVAADGRFTVRGVQPGEYQLSFVALPEELVRKNPWEQRAAAWRAQVIQPVTIPETDANSPGSDAPVDLGDVVLKIQRNQP